MKICILKIFFILYFSIILISCVTTNYYTARTLDEDKTVITPALDNLLWIEEDEGVIEKKVWFTPSLGIATGLPWRFETGIRYFVPYVLEANLRHQINPKSFEWFDISVNGHMGIIFADKFRDVSEPFYKYGLTISKEIYTLQPYFSYYLNKSYFVENRSNDISDYTIICFGVAIPHKNNFIFPEFNYYKNDYGRKGFFSFGIGLRVSTGKSKPKK
jgi:hypothetical protein